MICSLPSSSDRHKASGQHPALTAVHGFLQGPELFDEIASPMWRRECLPGHRQSAVLPLEQWSQAFSRHTWLGYSMGARLLLRAAGQSHNPPKRLVLVGCNPQAPTEERARLDREWQTQIQDQGLDAFIEHFSKLPRVQSQASSALLRSLRGGHDARGILSALKHYGRAAMGSLWSDIRSFHGRIDWILGEEDRDYHEILQGRVEHLHVIPASGHNPIADQPQALSALLRRLGLQSGELHHV